MNSGWIIVHGGALGDLMLTLQLALRLPQVAADGCVRVISRTDPGDLSRCRPSITRYSADALSCHWLHSQNGALPSGALADLLRGARVLCTLGDTCCRAHQRLLELQPACVYSFDPRPRPGLNRHITQQWLTDLEQQGLLIPKCIHQRPDHRGLGIPSELRARGAELLKAAGAGEKAVIIHPGSGGREKCWPLPNFIEVGRAVQCGGAPVCFLVGPVELECRSAHELRAIRDQFPVVTSPPPPDLVAVLAAARALVANDSGPAHLAALLSTATVTVFGPTLPAIWRPLGPEALTIAGDAHSPADWKVDPRRVAALALEA